MHINWIIVVHTSNTIGTCPSINNYSSELVTAYNRNVNEKSLKRQLIFTQVSSMRHSVWWNYSTRGCFEFPYSYFRMIHQNIWESWIRTSVYSSNRVANNISTTEIINQFSRSTYSGSVSVARIFKYSRIGFNDPFGVLI